MPVIRLALAILTLGLLALTQAACSGTQVGTKSAEDYNARPLRVVIPSGVDNAKAIKAAETALINRDWVVTNQTDDEISGKLSHRRFDAVVNIRIEGRSLVLYSDSTYTNPQTNEVTPGVPYGWLEYLKKDIKKFIAYEEDRSK